MTSIDGFNGIGTTPPMAAGGPTHPADPISPVVTQTEPEASPSDACSKPSRRTAVGILAGLAAGTALEVSSPTSHAAAAAGLAQAPQAAGNPMPEAQLGFRSRRAFFPVPDAALVRPLGQVAPDEGTPAPVPYAGSPGLGIPLGGFGAGAFMINQSGTFGPWSFGGQQGSSWEMRALPQAAFHVREQVGGEAATVRTLATDGPIDPESGKEIWQSPLPAWNRLAPGEGRYAALYPFGFTSYEPFATDVSMRFFSPIEAGEDRRTSLPVAYFDVKVANNTRQTRTVSVMFTMPNAPAHVAGTHADESVRLGPPSIRKGFTSRYDQRGPIHAVTLGADSPENTPDSARSEWTIATWAGRDQVVSHVTSWNAEGDGADVYQPFRTTGRLPDRSLDASHSAGALSVSVTLRPGASSTISFVLAWDFPQVAFADNSTVWMRRYTNFYGARETKTNEYVEGSYPFGQGFAIASDALRDHDDALSAVCRWWEPIATEKAYPTVLRSAALNQLAELTWNNSFWEGGLVRHSAVATGFATAGPGQHLNASVKGSHLFGIQDTIAGGVSGMGETTDIQVYNYRAYFHLFPNVQRDRLLASIESVQRSFNGNAHDLYSTLNNPYITFGNAQDAPIQGGTDSRPPKPGSSQWLDSPSKFIFQWYAFATMTEDRSFLRQAWPAIKAEITWLKGTIPAGQHLPSDPPAFSNPFNIVPQGPGPALFNSELYLLALTVAIAAGEQLHTDRDYVAGLRADLVAAKAEFEAAFWDVEAKHYRFATAGPYTKASTISAFYAQHLAESVKLPDLLDPLRHQQELNSQYRNFRSFDDDGEVTGAPLLFQPGGLAGPDGTVPFETDWVMVGDNFSAAADYLTSARRFQQPQLRSYALELAQAVATQIWLRPRNGLAFAAPWAWFPDDAGKYVYPGYSQALAVWDVLEAIKPLTSL
ncbi:GH116 family glycosyl-hydrolase [Kineococcus sp. R86509]|uniref:GH116 family glycosyl-hydrolase n=1 Tax=Kineococcus sp. R86509 TaxID=3093851 RepID=UPI0036D26817